MNLSKIQQFIRKRKGFRWITIQRVIGSRKWQYKIGQYNVVAVSENGIKIVGTFPEITGMTLQDIEYMKQDNGFHITPAIIAV